MFTTFLSWFNGTVSLNDYGIGITGRTYDALCGTSINIIDNLLATPYLKTYVFQFNDIYLSKTIICRDEHLKWISCEWTRCKQNPSRRGGDQFLNYDAHMRNRWLAMISTSWNDSITSLIKKWASLPHMYLQSIDNRFICKSRSPTLYNFIWNRCLINS